MTPRRLAALRAMAAQNASPKERDIAIEKLKALEDAPVGRKTVEQRPDGVSFSSDINGVRMDFNFIYYSPNWANGTVSRNGPRYMTVEELKKLFDETMASRREGPLFRKEG